MLLDIKLTPDKKQKLRGWFKKQPRVVQELFMKYPPGMYKIKEGAPYKITCAGSRVELARYRPNGDVDVLLMAENKLPECLEHERTLAAKHGRINEIAKINANDIQTTVSATWLEPVEVMDLYFLKD